MKLESNQGYEEEAKHLLVQYEQISFEICHRHILDLIPAYPVDVLDIGAGSGKDAGYLAEKGHQVVAVEPTDALRIGAQKLHPSANIEWVEDCLPNLPKIISRMKQFNLVMMNAVWMHLDQVEREHAMPLVAALLEYGGTLLMNLRHGPVPPGRRMFEIPTSEMLKLAASHNLTAIRQRDSGSILDRNKKAGVTWSHFVFRKER